MTNKAFAKCTIPSALCETQVVFSSYYSFVLSLKSRSNRYVIISHPVLKAYVDILVQQLTEDGFNIDVILFPSGEFYKSQETKQYIEEELFKKKCKKDTVLIALGGGVVCDITAFVASTYLRGVELVLIPTTLLCMVDAAIGGKTAINTSYGKNLLGSFYPAKQVFIDLVFLKTLPRKEWINAVAEIIKYGLIADNKFFELIESSKELWKSRDSLFIENLIQTSCKIKSSIVELDPFDDHIRKKLNFGHTIGHMIEFLSDYSISHGESVAIGVLVESFMSKKMCGLSDEAFLRIFNVLVDYEFTLSLPSFLSIETCIETLERDKKALSSNPRFVLLQDIGVVDDAQGMFCQKISHELLTESLEWMFHKFLKRSDVLL